ncbi:unnamed protein product [Urochloa humidicola]
MRHGLEAREECCFCEQEKETTDHILVNCSFAKEVWWGVLCSCACTCSFPAPKSLQGWWRYIRQRQQQEKRKGLDSLFMLTAWHLWKERNARLFQGQSKAAAQLVSGIRQEALLWIEAGAKQLGRLVQAQTG